MTLAAAPDDRALVAGALPDGLSVAFAAEPAADAAVRFGPRRLAAGERLVDVRAPDAWRRSPWPAGDALFEIPPPPPDAPVLVVGGTGADRLRRSDLERAGTVVFAGAAGFPALLPAAAAAGRLVILLETEPLFGWQDGIDCLVARDASEVTALTAAAARRPWAFDDLRAMARIAARPYRASELYARLAFDLSRSVG